MDQVCGCLTWQRNLVVWWYTWRYNGKGTLQGVHYFLVPPYTREKQREHCTIWPVTKTQNKTRVKNKQPDGKRQDHEQQNLLVWGKTNKLQCSFCSLAPPVIIIVVGLKFYSDLRHTLHWSSRRTREKEKKRAGKEIRFPLSSVKCLYIGQKPNVSFVFCKFSSPLSVFIKQTFLSGMKVPIESRYSSKNVLSSQT